MLLAVAPSAARSLLTATFSPVEAIVPEWTTEEAPRPRTPPRMTSFSVSCMVRFGGGREGEGGRREGGGEFFERGGGALLLPPPPLRRINSYLVPRSSTRAEVEGFSCCCCCGAAGAAAPATPAAAAPPPPAPSVAETAETENSEGRIVAAAHPSLPARIAAPNADGLSLPSSQKLSIADAETLVLFVDLRAASA